MTTANSQRDLAPSAFDPTAGGEVLESRTPQASGIESGFYTTPRGLPWHVTASRQLGEAELMTGVGGLLTRQEALAAASAGFTVEKWPLLAYPPDAETEAGATRVPRWYATVRTDTQQVLGVVGERYQLLQNEDAFAFADALVDDGGAKYETAGVLQGGAKVFLAMELPDSIHVAGDPSDYVVFLVFSNGHDGQTAAKAFTTVERVLCRNTLRIGAQRSISTWSARHSGSMDGKLVAAREALGLSFRTAEAFAETASEMVSTTMAERQVNELLLKVFPLTDTQAERIAKDPAAIDKVPAGIVRNIYHESPSVAPVKGTAYGVLNAVSEYVDHAKAYHGSVHSAEDVRANSLMFGSYASDPKRIAYEMLQEVAT